MLTYFDPDDTNMAKGQQEIRSAVTRLSKEGLMEEETAGRYRITPLVEVVMSTEKLTELSRWLRERNDSTGHGPEGVAP